MAVLGAQIPSYLDEPRSVIGDVGKAPAGNITLRIGRELPDSPGWTQTEYVVLTPDEAEALRGELDDKLSEEGAHR